MAGTSVKIHTDVSGFATEVRPFLMRHEAENQIILGMLNHPAGPPTPFEFLYSVHRDGNIIGAATKNAGNEYKLIVTAMDRDAALELARVVTPLLPTTLRGILGDRESAEIFATEWCRTHGTSFSVQHRQGILSCDRLIPGPVAPGTLRPATSDEFDLMLEWRRRFVQDCGLDPESDGQARRMTERPMKASSLLVWVHDGEVVSMLNAAVGTPNGGRIGLVYTPPHLRGRNYASTCVAAATENLLKSGKRFVCLFTDLANPISNKIYERIGFRRVAEAITFSFKL